MVAGTAIMSSAPVRIGCSGWQYRHWRGDLYPRELPQDRWFEFYAERFDTVELNNSFYRLPEGDTFAAWARRSPPGFSVAVKASRYLTHVKRLADPRGPLDRLWTRASRLGAHLDHARGLEQVHREKGFAAAATDGEQSVVAQDEALAIAQVAHQPRLLVIVQCHALVIVVGE